jgi:hypothetical protein
MVEDEFDRILQWISPLEPHKRHEYIKSKRMKGTGSWFLERDEFKAFNRLRRLWMAAKALLAYSLPEDP